MRDLNTPQPKATQDTADTRRESEQRKASLEKHKGKVKQAIDDLTLVESRLDQITGNASRTSTYEGSSSGKRLVSNKFLTKDKLAASLNALRADKKLKDKLAAPRGTWKGVASKDGAETPSSLKGQATQPKQQTSAEVKIQTSLAVPGLVERKSVRRSGLQKFGDTLRDMKRRVLGTQELHDMEETLAKKQYDDDDIDYRQKLPAMEQCYLYVETNIDRVLFYMMILTIIACLLTAFACYMYLHLPPAVYSYHILQEIYFVEDDTIAQSGFSKQIGLQLVTPLPMLIFFMYAILIYFVRIVQYPHQGRIRKYVRYSVFLIIEFYLSLGMLSYTIDMANVDRRLMDYYKHDFAGLKYSNGSSIGALHFLDHAQQYFGCCGFMNRKEWADQKSLNFSNTWPLSCCDATGSGIACYHPVNLTVSYTITWKEGEADVKVTDKNRLFEQPCKESERAVCFVVTSLVNTLTFIFIALSSWSAIIVCKIASIVTENKLEIKPKAEYFDLL